MKYGLKDCANLHIFSNKDDALKLYCDYAQTSTLEFSSNAVYARKKTVKAVRWDDEREGTLKTSMEIFDMKWIALLFGKDIEKINVPWLKHVVLPVKSGSAVLPETPNAGSLIVYKTSAKDKTDLIAEQKVGAISSPNMYSIDGNTLKFNTTDTFVEDGYIVAVYTVNKDVESFTVDDASFPDGYRIVGDTALRSTEQVDELVQFTLPNVKPQSNVTFTMDTGNVCTLEITWDIMSDANGDMLTWSKIADDE